MANKAVSRVFAIVLLLLTACLLLVTLSQQATVEQAKLSRHEDLLVKLQTQLESNFKTLPRKKQNTQRGTNDIIINEESEEDPSEVSNNSNNKLRDVFILGKKFADDELMNSFLHGRKILFNGERYIDTENTPSLLQKLVTLKRAENQQEEVEEDNTELADKAFDEFKQVLKEKVTPTEIYVTVKSPVKTGFGDFLKRYFESNSEVNYHPHNSFVLVAPSIVSVLDKLKKIDQKRLSKEQQKTDDDNLADDILWVGLADPSYKVSHELQANKKKPLATVSLEVQLFYNTDMEGLIREWRNIAFDLIDKTNVEQLIKTEAKRNVIIYKKKDLTIAVTIPQIIKDSIIEILSKSPLSRHIQKEESFGLESDFEDDEEEEADIPFSQFYQNYVKEKSFEQADSDSEAATAFNKLLSEQEYSLDDEETFQLLSAVNPLSDSYKSVLFKYGSTKSATSKTYLGEKFHQIANTTLNFVEHDKIGHSAMPDVKWMWEKGFTGRDQVIGIGDTGVDINNCCFYRRGQKVPYNKIETDTHDKFISYKSFADDRDIVRGHGSFVSSILSCSIKGDQFDDGEEMKDLFDGVVKDAKLCFFDLGLPTRRLSVPHDLSGDYFPYMHNKCNAKISTNSWGSPKRGMYTIASQDVDEWAYKNPNTIQLYAAGNSGRSGTRSITSPGTCKNCITVGSSQWTRKSFELGYPLYGDIIRHEMMETQMCLKGGHGRMLFATPTFCKSIGAKRSPCFDHKQSFCDSIDITGEKFACSSHIFKKVCCGKKYLNDMIEHPEHFSPNNMGTFSSRGPTTDGRIKPDIVAPGQLIFGSRSLGTSSADDSEEMADSFSNKGYCPVPIANQGTSFSTPIVAGYASMVHQYFTKGFYPTAKENSQNSVDPTGATLKAILVNSGQELTGMVEANGAGLWKKLHGTPSFTQGFGLVRLRHVLPFAGESDFNMFVSQQDSVTTDSYKQYCFRAVPVKSTKDQAFKELDQALKATLVWTDYPGSPNARIQLVNNLDLVVKIENNGQEHYGNGGRDYINNVEQVKINGYSKHIADKTVFRVVVEGTQVPKGPQTFSLIVNGPLEKIECTGEPNLKNTRIVKNPPVKNQKEPELLSAFMKVVGGSLLSDNAEEN